MIKQIIVTLILAVATLCGNPGKTLETQLNEMVNGFHGEVGIYIQHLQTGETIAINADTTFPTASMIKVPILIQTFDQIEAGILRLDSTVLYYADSIHYPYKGDDAISRFKEGEDITISKLIAHMLIFSDNHASLWLQDLCGGGIAINNWLSENGFIHTRMNSRTPDRHDDWEVYGWGQTSPSEMARLITMIRKGKAVSPRASEDMYRALCHAYWDGTALSQIPPNIQVASKQGAVDESRSEVLLVNAPHGDYVLCIATKNQTDTSWGNENEGFTLIRDVSRLVWKYFEPKDNWEPAPEIQEWW